MTNTVGRRRTGTDLRFVPRRMVLHAVLVCASLLSVYPFLYMINNSFKKGMEILNYPFDFPKEFSLGGYAAVFSELNMAGLFANTLFVAASVMLLNCLFNSMAAYAIEKMKFRGREILFRAILLTMMIPPVLLLIPTYIFLFRIGWKNTFQALIIPGMVNAYYIYLIKQYYKHINDAYVESAKIDGASHWKIFTSIILPMSTPVLSTVAILSFMGAWNDLSGPLLYITDESMYTLQLGLVKFRSLIPGTNMEEIYASVTVATVPVVVLYCFFQKQFMRSFANVSLR